ncbi:uncharacterized protein LOC129600177 [Paramacrobiotus metropolitanus]|uniref:uncharacterized protein LOC129600177 n=1 Tax=Paramacrobiotus metropolitanus TaxID=2943436 RepID=UPI002445B0AC|nr:uncharacterized protein LOC129600177 [Paramacrobiotus metropolitanus]
MRLLLVAAVLCAAYHNLQASSHKKSSSRGKAKSERKRNIDYTGPVSNTGYNSPLAQEQAVYAAAPPPRSYGPAPPPQNPLVFDALDILRGRPPLTAKEAGDVVAYSSGGKDFPAYLEIPKTYFSCEHMKPGLYADLDHYCQVYHRCDVGGKQSTYLCPPKTLFNQITLVCDWFYNVNCPNSRQFIEYSNSRLYYPQWHVLDTQLDYVQPYVQPPPPAHVQPYSPPAAAPQPPPVLYPGVKSAQQPLYSSNINGHENPEYQMSVVIRNPQLIPDYSLGAESNLMPSKEQLDQPSVMLSTPVPPPPSMVNINMGNGAGAGGSETVVVDAPPRANGGSVNVTINLSGEQNNQGPTGIMVPGPQQAIKDGKGQPVNQRFNGT